jgi:hypothetical protein
MQTMVNVSIDGSKSDLFIEAVLDEMAVRLR